MFYFPIKEKKTIKEHLSTVFPLVEMCSAQQSLSAGGPVHLRTILISSYAQTAFICSALKP